MAVVREQRTTPGGATYFTKVAVPRAPRGKARPAPDPQVVDEQPVAVIADGPDSVEPPPGAKRTARPRST